MKESFAASIKAEQEADKLEAEKKQKATETSRKRGLNALSKERIKHNYENMLETLESLSKKEKMIKVQKHFPSVSTQLCLKLKN